MQTGRVGPFHVQIPETRRERARGLRGRAGLARGEGLLLARCRSVQTFGMRFPIDAVLLDGRWRVVDVVRLPPGRVLWPRPRVRHIVEVAAGTGVRTGLRLRSSRDAAAP
jgi:uncharacterized protein